MSNAQTQQATSTEISAMWESMDQAELAQIARVFHAKSFDTTHEALVKWTAHKVASRILGQRFTPEVVYVNCSTDDVLAVIEPQIAEWASTEVE